MESGKQVLKEKNYLHCIKKIKSQKKELGPTLYFALIKNHNTSG